MRLTLCVLVAVLPMAFDGAASAQDPGPQQATCERSDLRAYREGPFKRHLASQRFQAAIDGLEEFLKSRLCRENLIHSAGGSQAAEGSKPDSEEYLWALSDLTLAYLKNDQTGRCLEITQQELNQYYHNTLESVGSPKLVAAFETNRKLCEQRRAELFPRLPSEPCAIGRLPESVNLDSWTDAPIPMKPAKIKSSIRVPASTGFDCIAVIGLSTTRGILDGMCDSEQTCRDTGEERDREPIIVNELFGIRRAERAELVHLDYAGDGWCGEPQISIHGVRSAQRTKAPATVLRVRSWRQPCIVGTGRGSVDSYFALDGGKLIPKDLSAPGYH